MTSTTITTFSLSFFCKNYERKSIEAITEQKDSMTNKIALVNANDDWTVVKFVVHSVVESIRF